MNKQVIVRNTRQNRWKKEMPAVIFEDLWPSKFVTSSYGVIVHDRGSMGFICWDNHGLPRAIIYKTGLILYFDNNKSNTSLEKKILNSCLAIIHTCKYTLTENVKIEFTYVKIVNCILLPIWMIYNFNDFIGVFILF